MFLDRRKVNGEKPVCTWEIITPSLGDSSTLNIGESPKDASVSSLSSILEDNVQEKYFLSERACEGILRRSDERGKPLPDLLVIALKNTIAVMRWKATPKTSEFPFQEITLFRPLRGEWVQGGGNVPFVIVPKSFECLRESPPQYRESEITATILAREAKALKELIAVPVAAGFMRNPSGDAGGIGYEEEISPTLLADRPPATVVPLCIASSSPKAETTDGSISPTLRARAGTGGGNSPMIVFPLPLTSTTEKSQEGGQ